jgi:hypothetical protein
MANTWKSWTYSFQSRGKIARSKSTFLYRINYHNSTFYQVQASVKPRFISADHLENKNKWAKPSPTFSPNSNVVLFLELLAGISTNEYPLCFLNRPAAYWHNDLWYVLWLKVCIVPDLDLRRWRREQKVRGDSQRIVIQRIPLIYPDCTETNSKIVLSAHQMSNTLQLWGWLSCVCVSVCVCCMHAVCVCV